jgi:hypothetical protein
MVKLDATSPTPESQSDLHIITWRVAVPPVSERKIAYQYTLEYPRDMKVSGLAD